jgi:hypothetical protein
MGWLMLVLIVFVLIFAFINAGDNIKQASKILEIKARDSGAEIATVGNHFYGLEVPPGSRCDILAYNDKIEINSCGIQYNIRMDQITEFQVKTEEEVKRQYVSSAGGAIGGALLFGAAGALIGGRTKVKEDKTIKFFVVIVYSSGDQTKYILIEVKSADYGIVNANKMKSIILGKTSSNKKVVDL